MIMSIPNVCQGRSRLRLGFFLLATNHNHGMSSNRVSATPSMVSRAVTVFDPIVSENEHLFSAGPILIPPFPPRRGAMSEKSKRELRTMNSTEQR
jgi:hypothetical protein